jgi:ketosteroid isomerase-like protein
MSERTAAKLTAMLVLGACAHRGAGPPVENELAQLKRDLVQAYIDRDAAALRRIYCDDFTVASADGSKRTKADELAGLATDDGSRLERGSYEPIVFRAFGDVVVMYGHGELHGRGADGPYQHSYDSFNVFARRDGRWCYAAAFTP